MPRRPNLRLAAALVASLSLRTAVAQTTQPDDNIGVFVRDSAVAADKLTLAERMEKAGQWDTSAEVYQEVLDGFADRVIATHLDAQGRADRYGGVTSVIQDRISAWPDAGREVYVARYGAPAAQMLAAADPNDRAALAKVADRYFITDAGRDATLRLIELHFDAGEFAACAALTDRLLDHHPAIASTDRPLLLLRSALAWTLAGETNRASLRAGELKTKFADVRATIGGEDRSLAEVAAAEIARPRAGRTASALRADAWPVPFGSNDHAGVMPEPDAPAQGQPPREWGKLLSFDLVAEASAPAAQGEPEAEMALVRQLLKKQRDLGASTGILPCVDGTQLFFQDNAHVYARDLTTGAAPRGWIDSNPATEGTYVVPGAIASPRGVQMAVTLTDRHVLAIVGQSEPLDPINGNGVDRGGDGARLICLDRATGKVLWWKRMSDAADAKAGITPATPADPAAEAPPPPRPVPINRAARARILQNRLGVAPNAIPGANAAAAAASRGDESLRMTEPGGSVLVVGDTCYVVARGGEAGAFEDCYLVAFGVDDGAFRWARHLASGNNTTSNIYGYVQAPRHAESHLAAADGRIFVSTDMGAIAAVDAADGNLAWLSLYPRPRPQQAQMFFNPNVAAARTRPSFEGNPVIVRDGKVLSLPGDGENLFVHDVSTGQEISRVPMKWKLDENYRLLGEAPAQTDNASSSGVDENSMLVGLVGDGVVVASPQSVSVLDWKKLTAGGDGDRSSILAPRDVILDRRMIVKPGFEDAALRGRPFVTDHSIYVPTAWQLIRLTPDTKFAIETYPATNGGDWPDRPDEAPGNVVVAGGNVIVAGPDRVSVYAGLGQVRQRLDAAIAAAPDSVAPRLRYAEAMANAAHNDEAMKWIDEAAARVAAPARPADDADRAMLFDECATLLRNLNRPGHAADVAFQSKLLTRLSAAAATPRQQVTSRLLRGGLAARSKDYAAAIEAYQQLLDDPAWAAVRAKVDDEAVPISKLASDAIAGIIATDDAGKSAYAAVESRAAAALEQARAGTDAAALLAVADRYPNSAAAGDAVRAAGELLTRNLATSPTAAATSLTTLRRLADRLATPAERANLNEAMLRTHLAAGDFEAALGRARRIAWVEPDRAISSLPVVQASSAKAIVDELQAAAMKRAEDRLPDLNANLDGDSFDVKNAVAVKSVASLLASDSLAAARHDRVVTIAQSRALQIFAPGSPTPLHTIRIPSVTDRTAITWLANDRLLLRQPPRLALVDVNGEALAWSFDPATLSKDADAAGGEVAGVTIDDSSLVDLTPRPPDAAATRGPAVPPSQEEQQLRQLVQQGNMDPIMAQRVIRQQRMVAVQNLAVRRNVMINNNGGVVVVNGMAVNNGADGGLGADPIAPPDAAEAVADATPIGDGSNTIILTTTRGRVVALDAATGKPRWRIKPTDRAPAALRVVGDVVVISTTDESASRVFAFDAATGNEVLRQTFTALDGGRVCDIATTGEGFLAIVTSNGVQLFDLLGGERDAIGSVTVAPEAGTPPFNNTRSPDLVQFCGGKLLVLADGGTTAASVRSFDLPKLTPTFTQDTGTKQRIERRYLPRYAKDQRVGDEIIEMAVHRDRLYLMTHRFMTSYPVLDVPGQMAWSPAASDTPRALSMQSPMFVREGLLTVGWPSTFVGQAAATADLQLYDRRQVGDEGESGMCVEAIELTRKNAKLIDKFQPVNGGIYYTTNDGTLVFLPGKPKS